MDENCLSIAGAHSSNLARMGAECRKQADFFRDEKRTARFGLEAVQQGQQLDIMFTITNTRDAPLIISEMQPSCGCIILDKSSHIIIPEDGIRQFKATYNSIKNVGEVVHRIRIFGNMLPNGKAELKFDVNVVPDADYTRDYEELYQDFNTKNGIVREMVDGKESELGYYVGEP